MRPRAASPLPRLVFLHIPKAAGTSVREIIKSVYGKDATFWHDLDTPPRKRRLSAANMDKYEGKLFLGGHRPRCHYPRSAPYLYCAVVREPVERVKSFYSYITRPAAASSDRDYMIRQRQMESWLRQGIDPDSLLRSLERCSTFRETIRDQQCGYICRSGRSFDRALKTLAEENFLVANATHVRVMIAAMADLFEWPETPDIVGNVSRDGVNDDILSEPGAVELINQLCADDHRLYDYIRDEHDGVYCNLPDRELITGSALNCGPRAEKEISRLGWHKVRIECLDSLAVNGGELHLELHNESREYLNPKLGKGIYFVYRLIDRGGQEIAHECVRTILSTTLAPGESTTQVVPVIIPERYLEQTGSIQVGMLHAGKYWIDSIVRDHAIVVPIAGQQAGAAERQIASKVTTSGPQ